MPPICSKHLFNHSGRAINKIPRGTEIGSSGWESAVVTTKKLCNWKRYIDDTHVYINQEKFGIILTKLNCTIQIFNLLSN